MNACRFLFNTNPHGLTNRDELYLRLSCHVPGQINVMFHCAFMLRFLRKFNNQFFQHAVYAALTVLCGWNDCKPPQSHHRTFETPMTPITRSRCLSLPARAIKRQQQVVKKINKFDSTTTSNFLNFVFQNNLTILPLRT